MSYKQLKKDFPEHKLEEQFQEEKRKSHEHDKRLKDYGMGKEVTEENI